MAGPAEVRFYVDANLSGTYDTGEVYLDSAPFQILERNHLSYTYMISDLVTALTSLPTAAAREAAIQAATDIGVVRLLTKDSEDDWRAAIEIDVNPYNEWFADEIFAPDSDRPDPATNSAEIEEHFDESYSMTILSDLPGGQRGEANAIPGSSFVVDWNAKFPDTIVHEIGHLQGIYHELVDDMVVMAAGTVPRSSSANKARFDDADKYSGASNSAPGPSAPDEGVPAELVQTVLFNRQNTVSISPQVGSPRLRDSVMDTTLNSRRFLINPATERDFSAWHYRKSTVPVKQRTWPGSLNSLSRTSAPKEWRLILKNDVNPSEISDDLLASVLLDLALEIIDRQDEDHTIDPDPATSASQPACETPLELILMLEGGNGQSHL